MLFWFGLVTSLDFDSDILLKGLLLMAQSTGIPQKSETRTNLYFFRSISGFRGHYIFYVATVKRFWGSSPKVRVLLTLKMCFLVFCAKA